MKKVFVSAGHSNTDPGAIGRTTAGGQIQEAKFVMAVRDAVSELLALRKIPHDTDGGRGDNRPLREAVTEARAKGVDGPRVEFHLNSLEGERGKAATGIEVLARPEHKALAQSLAAAVQGATGLPLRGDKGWKPENSGQHHRLAFISNAGGMICELGFVSNPRECDVLVDRFDALVKALAAWFQRESGASTLDADGMAVGGSVSPPTTVTSKVNVAPVKIVNVTPPLTDEQKAAALKAAAESPKTIRADWSKRSDWSMAKHEVIQAQARGEVTSEEADAAMKQIGPQPALLERLRLRIAAALAGLGFVGTLIFNFAHWLAEHRLEIAVWMTLAGVVILIVMQMRKEREA